MKNKNEILHFAFVIAMLANIVTAAVMIQLGSSNFNNEYYLKEFTETINNPVLRIILILSAAISLIGFIISIFYFKHIGELNKLDVIESELQEEKEKYRIATEAFKDIQKVKQL